MAQIELSPIAPVMQQLRKLLTAEPTRYTAVYRFAPAIEFFALKQLDVSAAQFALVAGIDPDLVSRIYDALDDEELRAAALTIGVDDGGDTSVRYPEELSALFAPLTDRAVRPQLTQAFHHFGVVLPLTE
ncbi:MAG: hypothetical protein LBN02_03470 [Oscillospiraceae bacterium]|jgi:hypothetical protein|nr:hypothetical protein [Oscillospiraceae bacterium]